jgi:phosphoenolpyruvate carboxykinase (ATP)
MSSTEVSDASISLDQARETFRNLSPAELVEHAIRNGEGVLAAKGALVARTGKHTGRTPQDKFTVREPSSEAEIWWENNKEMSPEAFQGLKEKARKAITEKRLYIVDTFGGADPKHRIAVRFAVEKAWHALFIRSLLIRPTTEELKSFVPDWHIYDLCTEKCDPSSDRTRSDAVIALNFAEREVLIMGTEYAGEMKKSVFTVLNYLLPRQGVLSMHCSANIGEQGDTALFFGLSGTGKTSGSAPSWRTSSCAATGRRTMTTPPSRRTPGAPTPSSTSRAP